MTHHATLSPFGPEESTALPIDDTLRLALALLWHASDCAQDAHAAPWDFAMEIGKLYETGLTVTDLRWLVAKGFVEHGGETSAYGDAHRSFTRSAGFKFLTTTCVVLTKKGTAFACHVLQTAAETRAAEEPHQGDKELEPGREKPVANGVTDSHASLKPHWNPVLRELWLGDRVVKQFHVPASHQEVILSAFQEEGWPEGIDDPLSGDREINPKIRLNHVIYRLNRAQIKPLVRFHTNGNGNGIHWSLCESKPVR